LTQKIARQPMLSVSAPPTIGPRPRLSPSTPPNTPIARDRSRGSVNTLVMMDIATGLSIEPPTACTIRNATSQPSPGATLHSNEPTVKTTSPMRKTRLRPSRSAVEPDRISSPASTMVYASSTHCRPATPPPNSCAMDGSATLTIVMSIPTISRLEQQIARTRCRRRWLSSVTGTPR
jgi:hypothetical protein